MNRINISIRKIINREKLLVWMDLHAVPESSAIIATAVLVGLAAGFGAVRFRRLIMLIEKISFGNIAVLLESIQPYHLIIIPVLGSLIFGPMIYRFAREAKGHGVPEVMEAVALRGGRIRPQVVVVKALASAICICTGGSVGREGPIAQIGSAIGSTLGQVFKLSDDKIRTLVACGAAGGIAATFNAPIGGAIFAMEVILGKLQVANFVAVVISAVIADVIGQIFEGNLRAFNVPQYSMGSPNELLLYTLLGIIAAVAAVGFTRFLYLSEDIWDRIKFPEYLKPMIGGALLGTVGILTYKINGIPRVFGVGYESIGEALTNSLPLKIALALFLLKILATSITIGSGGSGGIFAPSLFMGSMVGLSFGYAAQNLLPKLSVTPGAFALVGMAAFFSGAAHAPITSILILFEMTNDYKIILPLMLATVVSTLVARVISKETIYSLKLTRKGIHIEQGQDIDVMQGIKVHEVMSTEFLTLHPDTPVKELGSLFAKTHLLGFPVVDQAGRLQGIVTISDFDAATAAGEISNKRVKDICSKSDLLVALPDDPVWKPLKRMSTLDISLFPVVDSLETNRVIGIIRRSNIIRAYNRAIVKKANLQHKSEMYKLGKLDTTQINHIVIPKDSPFIGRQIKDISLPGDCLIVSIRRKDRKNLIIAHGHTIILPGDTLSLFVETEHADEVNQLLTGKKDLNLVENSNGVKYVELLVRPGAPAVGKRLEQISLPPGVIMVNIHRKEEIIIPHGKTKIIVGDIVELFGKNADVEIASREFV